MGGADKAFLKLGGETLIARTIARAKPQVGELLINANGDPSRFADFGLPVIADSIGGFLGPLAGILSGLDWMRANRPKARWLATFACDCPFFPRDMVEALIAKRKAKCENRCVPRAANAITRFSRCGARPSPPPRKAFSTTKPCARWMISWRGCRRRAWCSRPIPSIRSSTSTRRTILPVRSLAPGGEKKRRGRPTTNWGGGGGGRKEFFFF